MAERRVRESKTILTAENRTAAAFNGLKRQMGEVQGAAGKLRGAFSGLGVGLSVVGLVAGFVAIVKSSANAADELGKMSQKIGISVETLSELKFAAKLSDIELDALGNGLKKLSVNLEDAKTGTGIAVHAFRALKIDPAQFKTSDQALLALADRFASMEDGVGKTALAARIFGERMGPELLPLLNQGSAGIRAAGEELRRFGGIVTEEMAAAAEQFNDNLTRLAAAGEGVKFRFAFPLLSTFTAVTQGMLELASSAGGAGDAFDALGFIVKTFVLSLAVLGSTAAAVARDLGAFAAAIGLAATGNLKAAGLALAARGEDQQKELDRLIRVYDKLFNPQPFAKRLRGKDPSPSLVNLDSVSKNLAAQELKALDALIKEEGELLARREAMIQRFFSRGFIPVEDAFERQRDLLAETTQAQVDAVDKQIAAVQKLAAASAKPEDRITSETKIADLITKRGDLEIKAAEKTTKSFLDQADATEKFSDSLVKLRADLLDLQGAGGQAFTLRFDVDQRDFRRSLEAAGRKDDVARLDRLRTIGAAQADINQLEADGQLIIQTLRLSEERLAISKDAGAISELGLLGKLSDARRASLPALEETAEKIRSIAEASADPRLQVLAEQFSVQVERMKADADVLGQKFNSIFKDAFGDSLAEVIDGTKSVSEAFNDMANNVLREINRMVARSIADDIIGNLFTTAGGSGGAPTGLATIFGGAGEFFANLFKSARGAAFNAGAMMHYASGGIINEPTLFNFERGGASRLGLMGENGPEAIMPLRRGRDGQLGVAASGTSMSVVNHFTISAPVNSTTQSQIAAAAGDGVARAMRRNR